MPRLGSILTVVLVSAVRLVVAHEWHRHEDGKAKAPPGVAFADSPVRRSSDNPGLRTLGLSASGISADLDEANRLPGLGAGVSPVVASFLHFAPSVRVWWDSARLHVESDGMPVHGMMEGITAWQRQIPIPTFYFGTNDWRLPLEPVEAKTPRPIDTKNFLQGAIALAANGIPIFNPANNRGEISALIGELDAWGGHCGRADDYHYHAAPLHLTNVLGVALPIAVAMDGYPIYGLTEPDGSGPVGLDEFRGHVGPLGFYHYHASLTLPFVQGGFHGEVLTLVSTNGQGEVVSQAGEQPRVRPIRPSGTALAGAAIRTFAHLGTDRFQLSYSLPADQPATNSWLYVLNRELRQVTVTYSDAVGVRTTNYPNWLPAPAMASAGAPLVAVQPSSVTVTPGESVTLRIEASGLEPLSYSWWRDGRLVDDSTRFSGARTPNLVLQGAAATDAGSYSVVVSNRVGMTVSRPAVIAIGALRSVTQGQGVVLVSNLFPTSVRGARVAAVGQVTGSDGSRWTVPAATRFLDGVKAADLYNEASSVMPSGIEAVDLNQVPIVTVDPDGDVVTGYLFADNYFELFVNETLVAVDPVPYTPFNSCVVRFRAKPPITYAVRLVDWEENLGVGTELNGGNPHHAGDGGFIASFSDGTVTGPHWKAQTFYVAPVDDPNDVLDRADGTRDSSAVSTTTNRGSQAFAIHYPIDPGWSAKGFDDASWPAARVYTEEAVGVNDKPAYTRFPSQFGRSGATFIWSSNLVLDNEVLVRFTPQLAGTNTPPTFVPTDAQRFVIDVGAPFVTTRSATDAETDAAALIYRLLDGPKGLTVGSATGRIEWTPPPTAAGSSNVVRILVSDRGQPALQATNTFTVLVRSQQPNVVIIVTDDHGYGDLGIRGGDVRTPNLDRLGNEGIRLDRFYATPICSVTRSTFLTGRNPIRTGVNNARGLDLHEHILPQSFRLAGYQTLMCGKWHLGGLYNVETNVVIGGVARPVIREGLEYQPQNRGWNVHYGEYTGAIGYTTHVSGETDQPDWWLNGQPSTDAGWSTDLLADKASALLRYRDPTRPVLLYLAFNAVHGPVSAAPEFLARYAHIADIKRRTLLAALEQMDTAVGRVLATIDDQGLRTNTLVVFFGDNGGQQSNGASNLPLRGDKGDLFEGGIRTPAAMRWPGVLPSGVTNCQQFVWVGDLFPTLCAATGVPPQNTAPFDGVNLWPRFLRAADGEFTPDRWRGAPLVTGSTAGSAVYQLSDHGAGPTVYKLIHERMPGGKGGAYTNLLFDITRDPLETANLAEVPAQAGLVKSLEEVHATLKSERYGPYIGLHPEDQTAAVGSPVTFAALTTVYTTPLGIQWRRNGSAIPGATTFQEVDGDVYLTTLSLPSVSSSDAGTFDVVVTNAAVGWPSAVTSRVASLTVTGGGGGGSESPLPLGVLLGRPTDSTITVSVLAEEDLTVYHEYGSQPGQYSDRTVLQEVSKGVPAVTTLSNLVGNQRYYYRTRSAARGSSIFQVGSERMFHTQRGRGSTFRFVIEADPHNRDNDPEVWRLAMANMLADEPDFLIDLGDTFMEEKVGITNAYYLTQPGIFDLHREVRTGFFESIGHSVPTFLINGNHEAELGWLLRLLSITNNPAAWGAQARQHFFPVPIPGAFYSGATAIDPALRGPRDGYYAFEWGDVLIVALDPFWYTSPKPQADGWAWTLGKEQYDWLKRTLEGSAARHKFVFAHHLVGGGLGNQSRGGLTHSPYFEWGGSNTDGTYGFTAKRPGWSAPIRELLVRNGVKIFFHGHDHLFVKEDYDANGDGATDLIYQEVPQPSRIDSGTNSARGYGYTNSLVIGNSGHLRVTVSPTNLAVEYVRAYLPASETATRTNRMVSYRYDLAAPLPPPETRPIGISDTAQTNRFSTSIFGVDADYSTRPPEFLDQGDGTVLDRITGLVWQQTDGGEMTWAAARTYAATNRLAGHAAGAWRLPTVQELAGLCVYDRQNPALLPMFASAGNARADYWWSDDTLAGDPSRVWVVNAGGGSGAKLPSETLSAGGALRYHVRLILGPAAPKTSPRHRLHDRGDGTVTDLDSGLTWHRGEPAATMDWLAAITYAEHLELGGFHDWRLPNIKELRSLSDESLSSPSLDIRFFPDAKSDRYWSSTTQNNRTTNAWWAEFGTGATSQSPKDSRFWVRAVRGGLSNAVPVLQPPPNLTLGPGQILVFTNTATDQETIASALTYRIVNGPPGMTITERDGILRWRAPVGSQPVEHSVVVEASDSDVPPATSSQGFRITVQPISQPPQIVSVQASDGVLSLRVLGESGPDYVLEHSADLSVWTTVLSTNSPMPPFVWRLPPMPPDGESFYRVVLRP